MQHRIDSEIVSIRNGTHLTYYYSEYRIHDPLIKRHPVRRCTDMLARCPKHQPSTP